MLSLKSVIIFAIIVIIGMIAFNWVISSSSHHADNQMTTTSATQNQADHTHHQDDNIADKPLGQQPKAILDKANHEIDAAQELQKQQMAQLDGAN